jgi:hypothetical protein
MYLEGEGVVGLEVLADGGLAPLHVKLAEGAGPRFYCEIVLRVLLPAETVTDLLIFIQRRRPIQSWGDANARTAGVRKKRRLKRAYKNSRDRL